MRKPVVTAFESRNTARLGYLPLRISPQKLYHNDLQTTEQPYPTTDTARGSRLSSPSAADYFDSILPRRSLCVGVLLVVCQTTSPKWSAEQ